MNVEIENELRNAIQTGSVVLGSRESIKSVRSGSGRLVLIAKNCPKACLHELEEANKAGKIPARVLEYTSLELGAFCRRPHSVAVMVVKDAGNSEILNIARENKIEPHA